MQSTLAEVLRTAAVLPWDHALYVSAGAGALTEETPVLVWDVDDVVDDGSDLPAAARALGYEYLIGIQDVRGVVENARAQRPAPTIADLLAALRYYVAHDAFISWR
ncbi:hypothetical protein [Leucobacter sp. wl10]|uniref:DUF7716 domain-containing protein n=1 Tax=Leucobacter sp. wl10 TaxID=2304677 RepID=UPI000E5BB1EF|nr:hypothetical protein [Leucobacter sp. wl10]RGE19262.1 hypothetical protein D1J51_12070 [Leucobacter sp. wl10]